MSCWDSQIIVFKLCFNLNHNLKNNDFNYLIKILDRCLAHWFSGWIQKQQQSRVIKVWFSLSRIWFFPLSKRLYINIVIKRFVESRAIENRAPKLFCIVISGFYSVTIINGNFVFNLILFCIVVLHWKMSMKFDK